MKGLGPVDYANPHEYTAFNTTFNAKKTCHAINSRINDARHQIELQRSRIKQQDQPGKLLSQENTSKEQENHST